MPAVISSTCFTPYLCVESFFSQLSSFSSLHPGSLRALVVATECLKRISFDVCATARVLLISRCTHTRVNARAFNARVPSALKYEDSGAIRAIVQCRSLMAGSSDASIGSPRIVGSANTRARAPPKCGIGAICLLALMTR